MKVREGKEEGGVKKINERKVNNRSIKLKRWAWIVIHNWDHGVWNVPDRIMAMK